MLRRLSFLLSWKQLLVLGVPCLSQSAGHNTHCHIYVTGNAVAAMGAYQTARRVVGGNCLLGVWLWARQRKKWFFVCEGGGMGKVAGSCRQACAKFHNNDTKNGMSTYAKYDSELGQKKYIHVCAAGPGVSCMRMCVCRHIQTHSFAADRTPVILAILFRWGYSLYNPLGWEGGPSTHLPP